MSELITNIDLARQYLDMRVANHSIRSANIANAETPYYHAKVPSFRAVMDRTGADVRSASVASSSPNTDPQWKLEMKVGSSNAPGRHDGNNVSIDREMSALAENSLQYLSALKILSKEMAIARYAATSGGR